MSGQQESTPYMMFAAVLGALVVFTFLIAIIANSFSPASDSLQDPLVAAQQQERLMPIGKSRIAQ